MMMTSLIRAACGGGAGPRVLLRAVLLALLAFVPAATASAQVRPPPGQRPPVGQDTAAARRALEARLGRSVTHGEILERLRQSGLSRSEVRARLQQAGYDPGLADAYFDTMDRGGEPPRGEPAAGFIEALSRIGLGGRAGRDPMGRDTVPMDSLLIDPDSLEFVEDSVAAAGPEVFGLNVFRRAGRQFQPTLLGPVDPGYRLGPGDELLLVLTGDVESAYSLDVSREGFIFIPDVGQVAVNGLTLAQLEDMLYARLGRVYSGVRRGAGATTRFQISLGALRMNQVLVTGDVARPSSYQVSSVAGLFTALYQAGGPTAEGSFRRIEVHRGGRVHHVADLYDFLVRGDGSSDIRLEHNDRIFVPPAGVQVKVEGSVRRAAIYEMKAGEGVRDLLAFAGGLRSDALVRRVQIDRILPPDQQRPGYYRTLVDVDLSRLAAGAEEVPLVDGDVVSVFGVSDLRRNRLWVEGEVRNPGMYEWAQGATLWSALERADGLAEHAYTARAHVYRWIDADGTRQLIQASLERDGDGRPLHDLPLADNDSIVVLSRRELRTPESVAIDGFVKNPDTYPLARGMTLKDLILAAGGFDHGAYILEAEVSRPPNMLQRSDTTAYVFRVPLTSSPGNGNGNGNGNGSAGDAAAAGGNSMVPHWLPQADDMVLQHGDRVFIRPAPGYDSPREVRITGHVLAPGRYVLATREERLADLVERAGGLTPQAYPAGMHVVRDGRIVAADLQRGLRRPDDRNNIALAAGDSIHVPAYNPMVTVSGAVNFYSSVLYVPGRSLEYYVDQAGGYLDTADRGRITVTYANGERSGMRRSWAGRSAPRVEPGSEIFVPAKPEGSSLNWDQIVGRTAALLGGLGTLLIALSQLR